LLADSITKTLKSHLRMLSINSIKDFF